MKDYSNLHVERLEAELFEREFKRRNYKYTQSRGGKRVVRCADEKWQGADLQRHPSGKYRYGMTESTYIK